MTRLVIVDNQSNMHAVEDCLEAYHGLDKPLVKVDLMQKILRVFNRIKKQEQAKAKK